MIYLYLKALHIMAVISWMAGIFYLPRLFVYHADAEIGSVQSETFKVMERRLLKAIMTPAMIVAWVLGLYIAWDIDVMADGWFIVKLALVIALTGYHLMMARWVKAFAVDRNLHTGRFYRIINEVPTLLMIGIVIMVVVRPF
ncbi:MAG: protoporphyrinogen oxidase HemJ [Hyphomicrobiales bacterium]|nr:protoporphyrinogen oxidase HemJ [Hyphomicrobiales bacterium]